MDELSAVAEVKREAKEQEQAKGDQDLKTKAEIERPSPIKGAQLLDALVNKEKAERVYLRESEDTVKASIRTKSDNTTKKPSAKEARTEQPKCVWTSIGAQSHDRNGSD
ncbi:hypothetical protein QCA50_007126 [Cerrena zonata]|uniref:Uncharacterized protein n=1 Tax=Cerrena zonata TaxID=2478898 RepID=A0AAW0GJV1_9APHY